MSIANIAGLFEQKRSSNRQAIVVRRIAELDDFIRDAQGMKRLR